MIGVMIVLLLSWLLQLDLFEALGVGCALFIVDLAIVELCEPRWCSKCSTKTYRGGLFWWSCSNKWHGEAE